MLLGTQQTTKHWCLLIFSVYVAYRAQAQFPAVCIDNNQVIARCCPAPSGTNSECGGAGEVMSSPTYVDQPIRRETARHTTHITLGAHYSNALLLTKRLVSLATALSQKGRGQQDQVQTKIQLSCLSEFCSLLVCFLSNTERGECAEIRLNSDWPFDLFNHMNQDCVAGGTRHPYMHSLVNIGILGSTFYSDSTTLATYGQNRNTCLAGLTSRVGLWAPTTMQQRLCITYPM